VSLKEMPMGIELNRTINAFRTLGESFPIFLTLATGIFAYSTVISYSYYMETAVRFLFGSRFLIPFKVLYILVVIAGPALKLTKVIEFSDLRLNIWLSIIINATRAVI
jgi:AGCS family alanine or glycine:cation symporter